MCLYIVKYHDLTTLLMPCCNLHSFGVIINNQEKINNALIDCSVFNLSDRKRTISEVQFMHNVREHKQVGERQVWLQEKLKDIIVASAKPQYGQSVDIKNVFPNDILGSDKWKSWIQLQNLRIWQWNIFF